MKTPIAPAGATIRELIAVAQGVGNEAPAAVACLLETHEGIVMAAARSARPFKLRPDPDLLQEGRCALLVAIDAYRPEGAASFATFASLVVKRAVRRAAVRRQRDDAEIGDVDISTPNAYPQALGVDEKVVIREMVRTSPLSDRAQSIVFRRYWLQNTQTEIGQYLGISHAAVQKHEQRALTQLRNAYVA